MIVAYNTFFQTWMFITILLITVGIIIIFIYHMFKKDIEAQKEYNKQMERFTNELERYNDVTAYKEAVKIYDSLKDSHE